MNKIIYLDAAASALKPRAVIDAEVDFLTNKYANTGRGVCARAIAADNMLRDARRSVANFINAAPENIVFTSGTTDAMNRIANIVRDKIGTVAVSDIDHHSARLPFMAAARGRGDVVVMSLDADFNIDINRIPRSDVMVITAMSNVMGRPQDVSAIIRAARRQNPDVVTIVDAAQYVAHAPIDVQAMDADFVCFSGHKIGADTGVGVMYIKNPDAYSPDKFGGGMVRKVFPDGTWTNEDAPHKFEAGTLPLTQIAGMPAAMDSWRTWQGGAEMIGALHDALSDMKRIQVLTSRDASLITFVVDGMHPIDVAMMLGANGVCVRAGNMCASWIHMALNIPGSVRISVGPWNTMDEISQTIDIIRKIVK